MDQYARGDDFTGGYEPFWRNTASEYLSAGDDTRALTNQINKNLSTLQKRSKAALNRAEKAIRDAKAKPDEKPDEAEKPAEAPKEPEAAGQPPGDLAVVVPGLPPGADAAGLSKLALEALRQLAGDQQPVGGIGGFVAENYDLVRQYVEGVEAEQRESWEAAMAFYLNNPAADLSETAEAFEDALRKAGLPLGTTVEPPLPRWDAAAPAAATGTSHAWGLRQIGLASLRGPTAQVLPDRRYSFGPQSRAATVAVIGSGVDWMHPAMTRSTWTNEKEVPGNGKDDDGNGFVDDRLGWNFHDGTPDVSDVSGHDTLVAGIIASPFDMRGEAYAVGVNPAARIMALRVAGPDGKTNSIAIGRAILYAVKHGASVINISYEGDKPSRFEEFALDYAASKGVLVVVAAGNGARDLAGRALVSHPAVLVVAATGRDDRRMGNSNWGAEVDLAAPGAEVLGLRAERTDLLALRRPDYKAGAAVVGKDGDYYQADGTSFAAAYVSGVASLLRACDPSLTPEQVRRALLMSCDDVEQPGWDIRTGAGRLNALRALQTDPDYFLEARVARVELASGGDAHGLAVYGAARGTEFAGWRLEIAPGDQPADGAWTTVAEGHEPVRDGLLADVPGTRFDRRGPWWVRAVATDRKGARRESRMRITLR